MKKFKSYSLAAAGVVIFALTVAFISMGSAGAQGPTPVQPVRVVNTQADWVSVGPVLVRDADNPAFQPFQAQGTINVLNGGELEKRVRLATVPAGKRLVIEHAEVLVQTDRNATLDFASIFTVTRDLGGVDHVGLWHNVVLVFQSTGKFGTTYVASQEVRWYADENTGITCAINRQANDGLATARFTISGYLIDVPQPVLVDQ